MACKIVAIMQEPASGYGPEYYLTAAHTNGAIVLTKKTGDEFNPTQLWWKRDVGDGFFDLESIGNLGRFIIRKTDDDGNPGLQIVLGPNGQRGERLRKEKPAEPAAGNPRRQIALAGQSNEPAASVFSYIHIHTANPPSLVFHAERQGNDNNDPEVVLSERKTSLWMIVEVDEVSLPSGVSNSKATEVPRVNEPAYLNKNKATPKAAGVNNSRSPGSS